MHSENKITPTNEDSTEKDTDILSQSNLNHTKSWILLQLWSSRVICLSPEPNMICTLPRRKFFRNRYTGYLPVYTSNMPELLTGTCCTCVEGTIFTSRQNSCWALKVGLEKESSSILDILSSIQNYVWITLWYLLSVEKVIVSNNCVMVLKISFFLVWVWVLCESD